MLKTIVALFIFIFTSSQAINAETQIVAGAGTSEEIVKAFFDEFNKRPAAGGTTFNVMPGSIKHIGGIKNSDAQLFGRTGRPLSSEERELGKSEIILGEIPIIFAVGNAAGVKKLTLEQLQAIYSRRVSNWKQVGGNDGPIFLGGREPSESVFKQLKANFPWFEGIAFDKVFKSDNEVENFMLSSQARHAIIFCVKTQFYDNQQIKINGFSLGNKVGLVYDNKNANNPLVGAVKSYSASKEWQKILEKMGWDFAK